MICGESRKWCKVITRVFLMTSNRLTADTHTLYT